MNEATLATLAKILSDLGYTAHVDGSKVVLGSRAAAALAAEVVRLRERLAKAEAAPY